MAHYNMLLYKYLSKKHNVKLFSFKRQYPEFLFPGKTQFETGEPSVKVPYEDNVIAVDSINPFNWFFTALKIRKFKPDLLLFKFWIPFFAPCFFTISFFTKIFTKTKTFLMCDNVIPHERRFGDMFLIRLMFLTADYFMVLSDAVKKELLQFNIKKPYAMSRHPLYNQFGEAVDRNTAIEFLTNNYNIKFETERVLLYFGFIRKYKGLMYLLEAMPFILKQTDATLLVVGEFYEDSKKYFDKIESLGIKNLVFVVSDFVPDNNVRYFFCSSDLLVLPYIDASQSGIAQIAYYYDKPVLATKVGGLGEFVIDGRTGILVEPKNPEEIAGKVLEYYNENKSEEFIENIKEEKKKYSWEAHIESIENLVEQNKT